MGIILKDKSGQMTIEFVVAFPVVIIVAVIAVNALLFFSECAAFDRIARDAVRIYACSPAYEQTQDQTCGQIEQLIDEHFDKEYLRCTVSSSGSLSGYTTYTLTLSFLPTFFGMGLRSEVLGIKMPELNHAISLTVDSYNPGVLI